MSNSVDPDETAHCEPSHLDLRCLQKPIIIAYGSDIFKPFSFVSVDSSKTLLCVYNGHHMLAVMFCCLFPTSSSLDASIKLFLMIVPF